MGMLRTFRSLGCASKVAWPREREGPSEHGARKEVEDEMP